MKDVVHQNPWFSVVAEQLGSQAWYRVERPDSAMIVGSAKGRLLMVRGTRPTTGAEVGYEFPCGSLAARERPRDAALRETLEETGYLAVSPLYLGSFVESPGICGARCHVYTSEVEPRRPASPEPGEDWATELVSRRRLGELVRAGHVVDAGTLSAIALLRVAGDSIAG